VKEEGVWSLSVKEGGEKGGYMGNDLDVGEANGALQVEQ
jgi:hypothetical protein